MPLLWHLPFQFHQQSPLQSKLQLHNKYWFRLLRPPLEGSHEIGMSPQQQQLLEFNQNKTWLELEKIFRLSLRLTHRLSETLCESVLWLVIKDKCSPQGSLYNLKLMGFPMCVSIDPAIQLGPPHWVCTYIFLKTLQIWFCELALFLTLWGGSAWLLSTYFIRMSSSFTWLESMVQCQNETFEEKVPKSMNCNVYVYWICVTHSSWADWARIT